MRFSCQTPALQGPPASQRSMDLFQNTTQDCVVVAELQELGVGVFEKLDAGEGSGVCLAQKGCVPARDHQVVGVVGHGGVENFALFFSGEFREFATDDFGDITAVFRDQTCSGKAISAVRRGFIAEVNDVVVLREPFLVGADEGRACLAH